MLPWDINPTRNRPVVTWALIALNLAVWAYQLVLGDGAQTFVDQWGVVPFYLAQGEPGSLVTPITSMFMHASWWHIVMNMWFLFVFGDNIEDELGPERYLLFYVLAGLAAVALQVAIDPLSRTPMVGASGAIAGVLGAYMMLHPRARVIVLVLEVPAWVFLVVWFGGQLVQGFTSLGVEGAAGSVAFFAHVGGFVAGLLLVRLLMPQTEPEPEGPSAEPAVADPPVADPSEPG